MERELLKFVPDALRAKAIVAGGYAVDRRLATDIDVWIPSGDQHHVHAMLIRAHLKKENIPTQVWTRADDNDELVYANTNLVATVVKGHAGKDVQLLVSFAPSVQELLDNFDISTHMVAKGLTAGGIEQVWFGKAWTHRSFPAKVLRFTTPRQTLARLEKICDRYGIAHSTEDAAQLAAGVLNDDRSLRRAA